MQTKTKMLIAASGAALFAGAANAAIITLPALEVTSLEPYSHYFVSMTDDNGPVQFGPFSKFSQSIFNGSGADWYAVQFRIIEDPKEVYAPGEFAQITFNTFVPPTANGESAPGVTNLFAMDYLEGDQVIRFSFDGLTPHALFQSIQYAFAINNDSGRDIGYGLQVAFFPVPTPGSVALLAIAGVGAVSRRRR